MATKNEFQYIEDMLADFSAGMSSGPEPIDLPKNQAAFLFNATVRGKFPTNRPAYQVQTLLGAVWATVNAVGIFQGACYTAPDAGQQFLTAQIGGRLFTFTPDTNDTNVNVAEVTIVGDTNPSGLPQAWMVNAERWVVINNGVNNPIFYDTTTGISRRSVPVSASQATTNPAAGGGAGQFVTPVLGGLMIVPLDLTANPQGLTNTAKFLNQAIQLVEYDNSTPPQVTATTNWEVVSVGGAVTTYNITLKNLGDAAGATQGAGSPLVIQPGTIGNILAFTPTNVPSSPSTFATMNINLSVPAPSYVVIGTQLSINGDANWVVQTIAPGRQVLALIYAQPGVNPFTGPTWPPGGINNYPVIAVANTQPNVTVGALNSINGTFTAPAIGATIPAFLQAAYSGAIGQILFINGKQYQVTAYQTTPGASNNNVTLLNLNDTRVGHVFNASQGVTTTAAQIFNFPELPPGRNLAYVKGRIWETLTDAISYIASDIVGGSSGSPAYNSRDSILKVSENSLLANGGSFKVPANLGQIAAMRPMAQQDASLGQGPLMVVCPNGVFSCDAPTDRATWSIMTTPIVTEALIGLGGLSQNSTIVVNGDLMFRAVDGIRSLIMAKREFYSWGQTPISYEMSRVIDSDNVQGLVYASAVQFDNRMLMTAVPTQGPQGVYHQGLIALNFDLVSSIQGKSATVYDGFWTGINVLQLIEGQFSGVHRCFAFTYNTITKQIELYELSQTKSQLNFDNGTTPIVWGFESPMLFKNDKKKGLYGLCSLEDGEFYIKDIKPATTVSFNVQYQPDFSQCWFPWYQVSACNNGTSTQPSYNNRLGLGKPIGTSTGSGQRNSNFGSFFRTRYIVTGHCKIMGSSYKAALQPQSEFEKPIPFKS